MAYQAIYRKYRPQGFEELIGQEHVKQTIINTLISGRFSHAYLFSGPRGTGKTSIAKLLAKAVNCENPINGEPCNSCGNCHSITKNAMTDVHEIDAASNNGVDEIRSIREDVNFGPSEGKYKVYIIDEVHMLSVGAFNALLKTLEEPPAHVIFILATTEPHKIPLTIISRCQRFDFRRITPRGLVDRMKFIVSDLKIEVEEEALKLIAQAAQGGMRDALSLLDQTISYANGVVKVEHVTMVVGKTSISDIGKVIHCLKEEDIQTVLNLIEEIIEQGKEPEYFLEDLIGYYRDLLLYKLTGDESQLKMALADQLFVELSQSLDNVTIQKIIQEIMEQKSLLKWSSSSKTTLEVAMIKLLTVQKSRELSENNSGSLNPTPQKKEGQLSKELNNLITDLKNELEQIKSEIEQKPNTNNASSKSLGENEQEKDKRLIEEKVLNVATKKHKQTLEERWEYILRELNNTNIAMFRLLGEGKLVLASNDHMVVSFPHQNQVNIAYLDLNTNALNNALERVIEKKLKLIFVLDNDWEKIKANFIKNKALKK